MGQGKWLSWSGRNGYTGVYISFVISGFIIPYSLHRGGYTLRNFGRFLIKRGIRLYPPYLISIPVTVLAANLVLRPPARIGYPRGADASCSINLLFLNDLTGVPSRREHPVPFRN